MPKTKQKFNKLCKKNSLKHINFCIESNPEIIIQLIDRPATRIINQLQQVLRLTLVGALLKGVPKTKLSVFTDRVLVNNNIHSKSGFDQFIDSLFGKPRADCHIIIVPSFFSTKQIFPGHVIRLPSLMI